MGGAAAGAVGGGTESESEEVVEETVEGGRSVAVVAVLPVLGPAPVREVRRRVQGRRRGWKVRCNRAVLLFMPSREGGGNGVWGKGGAA